MEPGIPDPNSRATRLGIYNLDPAVRFWATPPIHGCLRTTVVHPVFEASGNERAMQGLLEPLCPGGCVVFIGIPLSTVPLDIVAAQAKEARIENVFRYAHVFPRALELMGAGKIAVKPLITDRFAVEESIAAFDYASNMAPRSVKVQVELPA